MWRFGLSVLTVKSDGGLYLLLLLLLLGILLKLIMGCHGWPWHLGIFHSEYSVKIDMGWHGWLRTLRILHSEHSVKSMGCHCWTWNLAKLSILNAEYNVNRTMGGHGWPWNLAIYLCCTQNTVMWKLMDCNCWWRWKYINLECSVINMEICFDCSVRTSR